MPSQTGSTSARFCDRAIIPSLDLAKVDVREQSACEAELTRVDALSSTPRKPVPKVMNCTNSTVTTMTTTGSKRHPFGFSRIKMLLSS
jgi:hypothetical protein